LFEISANQKMANGVTELTLALLIIFFIFLLAQKTWGMTAKPRSQLLP
jgi:hypothetical protein